MIMCQDSTELPRTRRDTFNFIFVFKFQFTEGINNKKQGIQLRSLLILCRENLIFWDMYFL